MNRASASTNGAARIFSPNSKQTAQLSFQRLLPTGQVGLASFSTAFFCRLSVTSRRPLAAEQFKVPAIREAAGRNSSSVIEQRCRPRSGNACSQVNRTLTALTGEDFFLRVTQQILLNYFQDIFKCQHQAFTSVSDDIIACALQKMQRYGQRKRGRPAMQPAHCQGLPRGGAYAPLSRQLCQLGQYPMHPIPQSILFSGLYPPGRALVNAPGFSYAGGSAGSGCCWNSASGSTSSCIGSSRRST